MKNKPRKDRRVQRTRAALICAFNDLVLKDRAKEIKVADIVERAHVGRSTFYEHYAGADDIHMQALARPFSILADAIAGKGEVALLEKLLSHFWDNRERARLTFGPPKVTNAARLLVSLLEPRLSASRGAGGSRMLAVQLAEGNLALIRCWVTGEIACDAHRIAHAIVSTSKRALVEA